MVIVIVVFAILPALLAGVISWKGRSNWTATQKDLAARGEKLRIEEWTPPPVPDEQNFFGDAMWKEVIGTREKPLTEGYSASLPAVPREKQQLGIMDQVIPADKVAVLKKRWPRFAGLDYTVSRRGVVAKLAFQFRNQDEAWRRDYAGFVLDVLRPLEPLMGKVVKLLSLPDARFPIVYEDGVFSDVPHLVNVLWISQLFQARAMAEIQAGQGDAAARDFAATIALSHSVKFDLLLISYLVRVGALKMALSIVYQGIAMHAWTELELNAMDEALTKEDFLGSLEQAFRAERACFNRTMDHFRQGGYRAYEQAQQEVDRVAGNEDAGWMSLLKGIGMRVYLPTLLSFDQASQNLLVQRMLDAMAANGWKGMNADPAFQAAAGTEANAFALPLILTQKGFPATAAVAEKGAAIQDRVIQARLAIALERYYLAHQEYPRSLDTLVPDYLENLPPEILTGERMHYDRTSPGSFLLWADGWDGKNDAGTPVKPGETGGDWVWGK